MKSNSSKLLVLCAAGLFMIAMTMTSCNRGYGCPYELKSAVKIVTPLIKK